MNVYTRSNSISISSPASSSPRSVGVGSDAALELVRPRAHPAPRGATGGRWVEARPRTHEDLQQVLDVDLVALGQDAEILSVIGRDDDPAEVEDDGVERSGRVTRPPAQDSAVKKSARARPSPSRTGSLRSHRYLAVEPPARSNPRSV